MKSNLSKAIIFVFFVGLAILPGAAKSFAQDDSSSDEQARDAQTKETLNQIHDLEAKMDDNAKRLDALEKAVNQANTEVVPVTEAAADTNRLIREANNEANNEETQEQAASVNQAPVEAQEIPAQEVTSLPAEAPVQFTPYAKPTAEVNDFFPSTAVYYAPLTYFPKEHTLEIAQEDFYSNFKTTGSHGINVAFDGIIYDHKNTGAFEGLKLAYTYRPLDAGDWLINVFHFDVHGDFGGSDYNYGDGDKLRDIDNYILEPKAWLGKDFNFGSYGDLTPYLGVGYRWFYEALKNKIELTDEDDPSLQMISNDMQTQYLYIPLGVNVSFRPAEGWRIDMNSEYDFLVWGRVTEYPLDFTDGSLSLSSSSINNTLHNGFGLCESIKIVKGVDSFNYFIEPFFQYWDIRPSKASYFSIDGVTDTSDPIQQDKNETIEVGARFGVEF